MQSASNNHANQLNPNHAQYQGGSNHANQLNPNNVQYRGCKCPGGVCPAPGGKGGK
jgi:hypothetical protein